MKQRRQDLWMIPCVLLLAGGLGCLVVSCDGRAKPSNDGAGACGAPAPEPIGGSTAAYSEASACLMPDVCAAACKNGFEGSPPTPSCELHCEKFRFASGGCGHRAQSYLECLGGDATTCRIFCSQGTAEGCYRDWQNCVNACDDTLALGNCDRDSNCCFFEFGCDHSLMMDCHGQHCKCYLKGAYYGSCEQTTELEGICAGPDCCCMALVGPLLGVCE